MSDSIASSSNTQQIQQLAEPLANYDINEIIKINPKVSSVYVSEDNFPILYLKPAIQGNDNKICAKCNRKLILRQVDKNAFKAPENFPDKFLIATCRHCESICEICGGRKETDYNEELGIVICQKCYNANMNPFAKESIDAKVVLPAPFPIPFPENDQEIPVEDRNMMEQLNNLENRLKNIGKSKNKHKEKTNTCTCCKSSFDPSIILIDGLCEDCKKIETETIESINKVCDKYFDINDFKSEKNNKFVLAVIDVIYKVFPIITNYNITNGRIKFTCKFYNAQDYDTNINFPILYNNDGGFLTLQQKIDTIRGEFIDTYKERLYLILRQNPRFKILP